MGLPKAAFDGAGYVPVLDHDRLEKQIERVFETLQIAAKTADEWLTLPELEGRTGDGTPSISAQIRHLRKAKFGRHIVQKRRRGGVTSGLWEYRLIENPYGADPGAEDGTLPDDEAQMAAEAAFWNNKYSGGTVTPKTTVEDDLLGLCVLNFMSDFYGGSARIEKMGTPDAENWRITFSVGHNHKKFAGEAPTIGLAMTEALKKWPEGQREWKKHLAALGL